MVMWLHLEGNFQGGFLNTSLKLPSFQARPVARIFFVGRATRRHGDINPLLLLLLLGLGWQAGWCGAPSRCSSPFLLPCHRSGHPDHYSRGVPKKSFPALPTPQPQKKAETLGLPSGLNRSARPGLAVARLAAGLHSAVPHAPAASHHSRLMAHPLGGACRMERPGEVRTNK